MKRSMMLKGVSKPSSFLMMPKCLNHSPCTSTSRRESRDYDSDKCNVSLTLSSPMKKRVKSSDSSFITTEKKPRMVNTVKTNLIQLNIHELRTPKLKENLNDIKVTIIKPLANKFKRGKAD